ALSETRQKLGWSAMYDYRAGGLYAPHLKVWLEHFHENVFVILFEDLVENPITVLSLLFEFLEADCDITKLPHLNQGGRGRARWKVIIFLRGAIQGFLPKKFRRSLLTHISNVISWRKLKKKPSISTETRQSILAHAEEGIRKKNLRTEAYLELKYNLSWSRLFRQFFSVSRTKVITSACCECH
ncbi:MAG: hypothetical protein ABJ327_03625, partial [Litoreibacter sp.]